MTPVALLSEQVLVNMKLNKQQSHGVMMDRHSYRIYEIVVNDINE